jgi:hypothetical protein
MKNIKLLKPYEKKSGRVLPQGKVIETTPEFGEELVSLGIAEWTDEPPSDVRPSFNPRIDPAIQRAHELKKRLEKEKEISESTKTEIKESKNKN